jgi:acetylornithine/succinyldiaminopimelate/putrescine aminotransferase
MGDYLKDGLTALADKYPFFLKGARGLGLMLGIELTPNIPHLPGDPTKTQAVRVAHLLHTAGLLTIPAGPQILRLLPPLNLRRGEAEEGLQIVEAVASRLGA